MRVSALVMALGLSAVDLVAAGVCRPSSSLSSESASATEASSSTASISAETSSTATSTDASSTTLSASTTSAAETTSTEAATSTTSTSPPAIPTFNVVARGSGSVDGSLLSSSYRAPFITFGYSTGDASDKLFSIEPETGRLKTSQPDTYVCASFSDKYMPAYSGRLLNCIPQNIETSGDYLAYLTCGLGDDGKVTCTVPLTECNDENFEWECYRDASGATMGKLLVGTANTWGYTAVIGRDVPPRFTEVEWSAAVV